MTSSTFVVNSSAGIDTSRTFDRSRTAILRTTSFAPTLDAIRSALLVSNAAVPEPTMPQPISPMPISRT